MIQTAGDMLTDALGGREAAPAVRVRNAYDAARDTKRRKRPSTRLRAEDAVLSKTDRKRVVSSARDLRRNFPDAAWAIRKHLDFVSSFTFQARTNDDALDTAIEAYVAERSRRQNCDLAGRHPLRRFVRLMEASRTVDGDVFALKLVDGRMQAIEGDRVRDPKDPLELAKGNWTHGVRVSRGGMALAYCVHQRRPKVIEATGRIFPARLFIEHAFYDRFDQVRGVTPLSTALNTFRDLYESRDYALAKAKVAQLFGLTIYREASEALGEITASDEDGDGEADAGGYDIDFDKGPVLLDLDPGDRAEFLENKTPSGEFRDFDRTIIASSLKSLDLPFSFYDESHTNFFGSKGALQQYLFSARQKREDVKDVLAAWTRWQIGLAVADGTLRLPRGRSFEDLAFDWIHVGLPWWKPLEEVKAFVEAIKAGLTSTVRATRERGEDAYEIAAEEIQYRKYRAKLEAELRDAGGTAPGDEDGDTEDEDGPLARLLAREMEGGSHA